MIDPQNTSEIAGNSVSDASSTVQPTAASDPTTAAAAPVNPDDLHDLFVVAPSMEGSDEEDPMAQLRKDPNYAALIRDLEYIASEARKLFATAEETPSDELWGKIQKEMDAKPDET